MTDFSSAKSWTFDWWKAVLYSTLLHLVALLVLALVKVNFRFEPPEFTEISFAVVTPSPPARQSVATPPEPAAKPAAEEPSVARQADRGSELIKLPKRRMLEPEEPALVARDAGKLSPTEAPSPVVPEKIEPRSLPGALDRDFATQATTAEKSLPKPTPTEAEPKATRSPTTESTSVKDQPFVIEGEAAKRTILVKVIPKYPRGVNKEAVVRIRFSVLPNGMVGRAVLARKSGEATLERITLEAFRQWRFNALPPDVPQVEQEGIITFRWVLK